MSDAKPVNPAERLVDSVSTAELERRWKAAREMMAERGLDYLVMQNQEEFLGGTLRWFSDFAARHQYPTTVIFPADAEMTVISSGTEPPARQPFPPMPARGIRRSLGAVYFPTTPYSSTVEGRLIVDALREKKNPTVGWVDRAFLPVTVHQYVVENLPGATFVDATEWVDRLRVVKSPEEIELVRACAALQDACVDHLAGTIAPGMRDYEVYAEAHYYCSKHGSSRGIVQVGSGPLGTAVPFDVYRMQNHVIQAGDQVSVLIEVNGPGGYFSELTRIFTVQAEPPQTLEEAFANAAECQQLLAKAMVPGTDPGELWRAQVEFLTERGYSRPARSFAHGQGLSLVERPNIRPEEPWKLEKSMILAVHPIASRDDVWASACDSFVVGDEGAERLHKCPQTIVCV
jgi:Xaa-Pro aminopeptidase